MRAWDIYLNNKDIMSDDEVKVCLLYGINHNKGQKQWEQTKEIKGINFRDLFSFVKWEDEEATAIEDILNDCEIVEDK